MKTLIIGSEGTIGRHLIKLIPDAVGVDIILDNEYRCDLRDPLSVEACFQKFRPDQVVLLASAVGRVRCTSFPKDSLEINVNGCMNVITAILKYTPNARLLYTGTSESYGDLLYRSVSEDDRYVFPSYRGIYSLTKMMAEKLIEFHIKNFQLKASIVRLFMCYTEDGSTSNDQTAISRMMRSALKGEPIEVHSQTSRSWCHVEDTVRGIKMVMDDWATNTFCNIGNTEEFISNEVLALKIKELTKSKSQLNIIADKPADIYPHKRFTSMANSLYGFEPKITLTEGLERMYNAWK